LTTRLGPRGQFKMAGVAQLSVGDVTLQFQHGVQLVGEVGEHGADVVEHVALLYAAASRSRRPVRSSPELTPRWARRLAFS